MFSVFSMLPVRERENGVKTLQKCSGAPLWLTWLANYCWDFLNAFPSLLIILLIFVSSQSIGGFDTFAENSGKHGRFSGRDPNRRVLFEGFRLYICVISIVYPGTTAFHILSLVCFQGKFWNTLTSTFGLRNAERNFKTKPKVPASAIMTSSVLNIMLSLVTYLAVFILKIIESTRDIGNALNNLFLIFPQGRFQEYADQLISNRL